MSPTSERLEEIADEVAKLSKRAEGPRQVKLLALADQLREGETSTAVEVLDAAATWPSIRSEGQAFTALADEFRGKGDEPPADDTPADEPAVHAPPAPDPSTSKTSKTKTTPVAHTG